MPLISIFAEYFIFWWITLFIVLPIGLRTQADESQGDQRHGPRAHPRTFPASGAVFLHDHGSYRR